MKFTFIVIFLIKFYLVNSLEIVSLNNLFNFITYLYISKNTAGCDKEYGCFRQPSDCSGKNCDYFVSWKSEGEFINFQMSAKMPSNNAYLAVGFSKDSTMVN